MLNKYELLRGCGEYKTWELENCQPVVGGERLEPRVGGGGPVGKPGEPGKGSCGLTCPWQASVWGWGRSGGNNPGGRYWGTGLAQRQRQGREGGRREGLGAYLDVAGGRGGISQDASPRSQWRWELSEEGGSGAGSFVGARRSQGEVVLPRAGYVICGAPWKIKMQGSLFKKQELSL